LSVRFVGQNQAASLPHSASKRLQRSSNISRENHVERH
jgi:hypothetical protein